MTYQLPKDLISKYNITQSSLYRWAKDKKVRTKRMKKKKYFCVKDVVSILDNKDYEPIIDENFSQEWENNKANNENSFHWWENKNHNGFSEPVLDDKILLLLKTVWETQFQLWWEKWENKFLKESSDIKAENQLKDFMIENLKKENELFNTEKQLLKATNNRYQKISLLMGLILIFAIGGYSYSYFF